MTSTPFLDDRAVGRSLVAGRGLAAPPALLYGTAWKEDDTEALVALALSAGFRGIDTANQRKHYVEAGVGGALTAALATGAVRREELFIQTKYTFARGQDHRLPYDPAAPVATQVRQSFERSQQHLGLHFIDSLVLHGPMQAGHLHALDYEAWRAMEALVEDGLVGSLGISNVEATQVSELVAFARVAPRFVQNRCYANQGWDAKVRSVCRQNGVVYQGFSLLTANRQVLAGQTVRQLAARYDVTPAQVVFRFAQLMEMLPLTGTRDPQHMRDDLAALRLPLTKGDVQAIQLG
ncbi:MAG: aldo/keto reductase [Myxococcales bacterium]|nr:aldo/keto reductase [Myxococcales bacterium]